MDSLVSINMRELEQIFKREAPNDGLRNKDPERQDSDLDRGVALEEEDECANVGSGWGDGEHPCYPLSTVVATMAVSICQMEACLPH